MDLNLVAASILIALGAALMLVNIINHRHTMRDAAKRIDFPHRQTRIIVRVHHVLMLFFFIGYIAVLISFIQRVDIAGTLFVAIIFFFGAIFVHLGILVQKRMFDALQAANDNLEEDRQRLISLNVQLQDEIDGRIKAETSDQMKSDFLSLVSHELRTPLTSIYGFTKLIEKRITVLDQDTDPDSFAVAKDKALDNLNIVSTECSRLTRMINNVLDLEKIESGQMDWEDRRISLNEVISNALNALDGVLSVNDGVSVKVSLPDTLPDFVVDPDLFTQVIINIVNNAIKFTPAGVIRVESEYDGDAICLSIRDQGRGIPHDSLERIFDKFHVVRSGDTLGEKRQGTGLGLPICKQIVTHYDGKIWAESTLGEGSTFFILLPKTIFAQN